VPYELWRTQLLTAVAEHKAASQEALEDKATSPSNRKVPEENALAPLVSAFSDKKEEMGTTKDIPLFDTSATDSKTREVRTNEYVIIFAATSFL
jgi:hypothetical protein